MIAYTRHEVFGGALAGLFALAAYADSRSSGRWTGAFEAPAANTGVSPLAAQMGSHFA